MPGSDWTLRWQTDIILLKLYQLNICLIIFSVGRSFQSTISQMSVGLVLFKEKKTQNTIKFSNYLVFVLLLVLQFPRKGKIKLFGFLQDGDS